MTPEARINIVPQALAEQELSGYAHPQVLRFMKAAIKDGAHLQILEGSSPAKWARKMNITGIYLYTQASLGEIGKIYGVTKQRVSQIVKNTLRVLWNNSSAEIQKAYPLGTVLQRKPETPRVMRKRSQRHGGLSVAIEEALREGKAIARIQKELDLSNQQIWAARKVLRGWGIEVPIGCGRQAFLENRELADQLRMSADDQETQEVLSRVGKGFLQKYGTGEDPVVSSVARTAWKFGFHFVPRALRLFVQSLKESHLPVGQIDDKGVRYFFISTKQKERVRDVWFVDPRLQRFLENPVKQVCGPESEIPITTKLQKKDGFDTPTHILVQLGVPRGKSQQLIRRLLDRSCPVPIFRQRRDKSRVYYYPIDHEDQLREFFRRRLEESQAQR